MAADPEQAVVRLFCQGTADSIVALAWLCHHCRWHEALPPGVGDLAAHVDFNARRSIYGRIVEAMSRTPEGRQALEAAHEWRRRAIEEGDTDEHDA